MINQRYILQKKLGEGRSSVYLCSDSELGGREFAIKILSSKDPDEKRLFNDEFFSLKRLDHPLIVKPFDLGSIVDAGTAEESEFLGSRFFTLEYFPGSELLAFGNTKDHEVLKQVLVQICSVLYYLHQSNYIYYDLKPENILAAGSDGIVSIRLIDLGLASRISDRSDFSIKGTAEYIAPEILREEKHDHRVDLYSLGILLYRIIYGRFPFGTDDKIGIYKAHIEKEFEFPVNGLPAVLMGIMKKLLKKNPYERYQNSLQILKELASDPADLSMHLIPPKICAGRKDIINTLSAFTADKESTELFIIKGAEGSGKTTLINEFYSLSQRVIPVFNKSGRNGFDFIKLLLKNIVFNDFVYPEISGELKDKILDFLSGSRLEIVDQMKSIISQIAIKTGFIFIVDDFNRLDRFSFEVIKEIIPILQVNNIKVILAEANNSESLTDSFHNKRELVLNPFTEQSVQEFVEAGFAGFFPRNELKKLILLYSDLLPGSIIGFIRDLIFLKIISYSEGSPGIKSYETSVIATVLRSSQEEIYNIRLHSLSETEVLAAKFISAFETPADLFTLKKLLGTNFKEAAEIAESLTQKNIIHFNQQTGVSVITSEGFRKHIYSAIADKKKLHSLIGDVLSKSDRHDINRNETARHYELADNIEKACLLMLEEAKQAEDLSAFSYEKKVLLRLSALPCDEKKKTEIKHLLCHVHYRLSEFQNSIDIIDELLQGELNEEEKNKLLILRGSCLVELGKYQEGKDVLKSLIPEIKEKTQKLKLLTEIANAEFELGRYDDVKEICSKVVEDPEASVEVRGKCYSLLGHRELLTKNDLDKGLKSFEEAKRMFSDANLNFLAAGMEINIGNIYYMKDLEDKAKDYWESSLIKFRQSGNIIREANILNNFGVYSYKNGFFDRAKEDYIRAKIIYNALGSNYYEGSVLNNLGELLLINCDYQNAIETLSKAYEIFSALNKSSYRLNSLFLLGKIYFVLGAVDELSEIIIKYKSIMNLEEIQEKNKNNLTLLNYFYNSRIPSSEQIDELISLQLYFHKSKDELNYLYVSFLLSYALLELSKYENATEILSIDSLVNICKRNFLYDAEREYLFGLISEKKSYSYLKAPLYYFESAYDKIINAPVTELTWKLLFSLGMYYFKRGNIGKARDYFYYSKSVIFNIADSIKDSRLKENFFDKIERKTSLEIIHNELS